MPTAFLHLAVRGWGAMIAASSTSTFGFLCWMFGSAVSIGLAQVSYNWLTASRERGEARGLFPAIERSWKLFLVELGALLGLTFLVWGTFVVRTVYYERTGMRWAYAQEVRRNEELSSQIHLRNRGITSDDPAYMGLVQILRQFQSYGSAVQGKPCTIVFTSEPDSLRIASAIAEASALVSGCNTFGPDAPGVPDSIGNKEEGMVPGVIVVHSTRENHAAISFQRGLSDLLPTRYSYVPPKNPSFATTNNIMWLQFGSGVGWRE